MKEENKLNKRYKMDNTKQHR